MEEEAASSSCDPPGAFAASEAEERVHLSEIPVLQMRAARVRTLLALASKEAGKFVQWRTESIDSFNAASRTVEADDDDGDALENGQGSWEHEGGGGANGASPTSASPLCDTSLFLNRIERTLAREEQFIAKLQSGEVAPTRSRLRSTNMIHVESLVMALIHCQVREICGVHCQFPLSKAKHARKVVVDVVCDSGQTWVVVIARNPMSLSWKSERERGGDRRGLLDRIEDLRAAAEIHGHPSLILLFGRPLHPRIEEHLVSDVHAEELWSDVHGGSLVDKWVELGEHVALECAKCHDRVDSGHCDDVLGSLPSDSTLTPADMRFFTLTPEQAKFGVDLERVNLDATALLALITDVGHGDAPRLVKHSIDELAEMTGNYHSGNFMKKQCEDELKSPVIAHMTPLIEGKQLIATPIALHHVLNILNTMGSETERARSEELFQRVMIVGPANSIAFEKRHELLDSNGSTDSSGADEYDLTPEEVVEISERVSSLKNTRIVQDRHKEVFGVADTLRVVTLTSNLRFVQTAAQSGVYIRAVLHAPRALVTDEVKQELERRTAERENDSYTCGLQ